MRITNRSDFSMTEMSPTRLLRGTEAPGKGSVEASVSWRRTAVLREVVEVAHKVHTRGNRMCPLWSEGCRGGS